jgi:serine/threonine-protein kinase
VATSVAQQLKIKLVGNEATKFELGGTRNQEAYDAYLRGAQLGSAAASEVGDNRAELAAYDRAIALDPNYAAAHAGRAVVLTYIAFYADLGRRRRIQQDALAAARRAVALAPDFGEAHWALAWTFVGLLDFAGAAPEYDRALSLAPGSAKVQSNYAWFSALLGHFEPALTAAKRAVSLDPQSSGSHLMLSYVYYFARRYPEALTTIEVAKALNPRQSEIDEQWARLLLASGKAGQALALCEATVMPFDDDYRHWYLAEAYHALGREAEAREELRKSQQLDGEGSAYSFATVLAQLGDSAAALEWLHKALQARDPLLQLARIDWQLDPIRHEPQYQAIIAQLNFPP